MYLDRIDSPSTVEQLEAWVAKNLNPWTNSEMTVSEHHKKAAISRFGASLNSFVSEMFYNRNQDDAYAIANEALKTIAVNLEEEYGSKDLFTKTHLTQCPTLEIERDLAARGGNPHAGNDILVSATLTHHYADSKGEPQHIRRTISLETSMFDAIMNCREYLCQNMYTLLGKAGQQTHMQPTRLSHISLRAASFTPSLRVYGTKTFSTALSLTTDYVKRTMDINIQNLMNALLAEMVLNNRTEELKKLMNRVEGEKRIPMPPIRGSSLSHIERKEIQKTPLEGTQEVNETIEDS